MITGQGAWNPGCGLNLAVHNPHPQETLFQNTAEEESKATSIPRQVMWGRHHLLCSQVLTGPEETEGSKDGTCFPGDLGENPFQHTHLQDHFPRKAP